MNLFNSILFVICFISCDNYEIKNPSLIKWNEVANIERGKIIDFCQIDSIANNYVISLSFFPGTGGIHIFKTNSKDSVIDNIVFEGKTKNYISSVHITDSVIHLSRGGWEDKVFKSSFLYSKDLGESWNEINTPLEFIRKFIFTKNLLFAEGNLGGTTRIIKSSDNGKNWEEIDCLKIGLKQFRLIASLGNEGEILGFGLHTFSIKDTKLLLFNSKENNFIELEDMGGENYIKPISKNKYLHGIINNGKIDTYIIQNKKLHYQEKIKTPKGISEIKNIYLGDSFYIITARQKELKGMTLSWISYDKGVRWQPYRQEEEYQLISNSFGGLFMRNKDNNIMKGEL